MNLDTSRVLFKIINVFQALSLQDSATRIVTILRNVIQNLFLSLICFFNGASCTPAVPEPVPGGFGGGGGGEQFSRLINAKLDVPSKWVRNSTIEGKIYIFDSNNEFVKVGLINLIMPFNYSLDIITFTEKFNESLLDKWGITYSNAGIKNRTAYLFRVDVPLITEEKFKLIVNLHDYGKFIKLEQEIILTDKSEISPEIMKLIPNFITGLTTAIEDYFRKIDKIEDYFRKIDKSAIKKLLIFTLTTLSFMFIVVLLFFVARFRRIEKPKISFRTDEGKIVSYSQIEAKSILKKLTEKGAI